MFEGREICTRDSHLEWTAAASHASDASRGWTIFALGGPRNDSSADSSAFADIAPSTSGRANEART
jgi:hypothetical protein